MPLKHVLFVLFYIVLFSSLVQEVLPIYTNAPTSIIFIGNGQDTQAGFITDINNDGLPDFVMTYYQRDYNFASTTLFLNNGCFFVRHTSPFQPLEYCREYFINKQMLDWQTKPPIVNFTIPSENFTAIIQLPYHASDIPLLFDRVFGVKIREPHLYFFKAGIPIQYHAIATGDNIEYLRNPMNGSKYTNEDSTFRNNQDDQNQDSGDSGSGNGSADNNSSGTTNQQTGSLTSGASGASDIVGGNSNSNSGGTSANSDGNSGSSGGTKERPNLPRRDYGDYDYR